MAASSSYSESSAHSSPLTDFPILEELSTSVKSSSILDRDEYLRHNDNRAMTECVLQCLEDAGLMTYVTYDYKKAHRLDATEFYVNARLSNKEDAIHSTINGTEVTIVHGDIKALFNFPVHGGKPDYPGEEGLALVPLEVAVPFSEGVDDFLPVDEWRFFYTKLFRLGGGAAAAN
nr:uncharacterized protein LOC109167327 [Ipomoea batatas]